MVNFNKKCPGCGNERMPENNEFCCLRCYKTANRTLEKGDTE